MLSVLPLGWAEVPFAELLREPLRNGHSARATSDPAGVPILTLTAVTTGEFSDANVKFTTADPRRVAGLWLEPDDLLIQRSNTPELVGTARLFRGRNRWAVFPDLLIRARLRSEINARYVEWFLHSDAARRYFRSKAQGIAGSMPKISQETIQTLKVPLAPLVEQERIAAEIETQLARLEVAVSSLNRVRAQLKRYRASVLKAACEGRLVPTEAALARAEGREYESAHSLLERMRALLGQPKIPEGAAGLAPKPPEGWALATLGSLARDSGYGTSVKCSYDGPGVPVLRIPNIVGGRLDLTDLKRSVQPDFVPTEGAYLRPGDFLVVRTNGSRDLIGRAAVIESELGSSHYFASYLIRFRLVAEPTLWKWLSLAWQGVGVRRTLEDAAATSAGQYNLGEKTLAKVSIPIPPIAEQRRIIAEVERRLSISDEIAAAIDAALSRAARLRQSILKRAFEGKLAPQDPSDEPASVLLERIRKEREAAADDRRATTSRPAPRTGGRSTAAGARLGRRRRS